MENKVIKGIKLNMSQIFSDTGEVIPVTYIKAVEDLTDDYLGAAITLTALSKGKGFTGVMKRWNFKGGPATRGQSDKPRSGGSIGAQTPSRVFKGKKMAGKHGNKQITVMGSKILKIEDDKKTFCVLGPVPGARNNKVLVKLI